MLLPVHFPDDRHLFLHLSVLQALSRLHALEGCRGMHMGSIIRPDGGTGRHLRDHGPELLRARRSGNRAVYTDRTYRLAAVHLCEDTS